MDGAVFRDGLRRWGTSVATAVFLTVVHNECRVQTKEKTMTRRPTRRGPDPAGVDPYIDRVRDALPVARQVTNMVACQHLKFMGDKPANTSPIMRNVVLPLAHLLVVLHIGTKYDLDAPCLFDQLLRRMRAKTSTVRGRTLLCCTKPCRCQHSNIPNSLILLALVTGDEARVQTPAGHTNGRGWGGPSAIGNPRGWIA